MNKSRKTGILALIIGIALVSAFTACENKIMIDLLKPFGVPEKGSENSGKPVEITRWYTWVATQENNDNKYISTAKISIDPTSNNTGYNVTVTGTANDAGYVWAAQAGCNYTATEGKTYKATWKWKGNSNAFRNVSIRYAWYEGYEIDEFFLGTNENKLTIPATEETRAYYFTIPRNGDTSFAFQVGADTGSFTIRDFKIEEVEPIKIKIKDNEGTTSNGIYFHNYQEVYDISLPEIGGKITADSIYTFTYTFKSNVAITGDLKVFIVDHSDAVPEWWKELSDRKIIKNNIPANTEVTGTITLIATGTASSDAARANGLGFDVPITDAASEPTLTFTRFAFNKGGSGGSTTTITLSENKGTGYDQWQGYYDIPSSVRGDGIKKDDTFTFTYSFTSNVAIQNGKLLILLADTSTGSLKELSNEEKFDFAISANAVVSGAKTLTATGTASSSGGGANQLIFRVDPSSGAASEPILTFTEFTLTKNGNNGSTHTITFNANGGTVSPASGTTNAAGTLASLPTPTRSGYTFAGWYTAVTGGTQVTTSTVFSSNTTIYARWNTATNDGFNSIAEFSSWLASQPNNNAATPHTAKLNVSSLGGNSSTSGSLGNVLNNYNTKYVSLTLGSGITTIEDGAFDGCPSLTTVTIGNGVTSIGEWAFWQCTNLTTVTIPNSVTSIGEWAFNQCTSLTTVTIPNSVTSIGKEAFNTCKSLTSVTFTPTSKVASIGDDVFGNCTSLKSITIPNSVTSIGDNAFYYCTSLTSVTIGSGVTSIKSYAFDSCYKLTSVTFERTGTTIAADNSFPDGTSLRTAYSAGGVGIYTRPDEYTAWTKQN